MELYWKCVAVCLVAAVLGLALEKQEKQFTVLLGLGTVLLVMLAAMTFFGPVLDFLDQLENLGQLPGELPQVLLKAAGIGIVGEMAAMVCADSQNSGLGKVLNLLTTVVILRLSLPVFQAMLDLIREILGDL